jgi:hypothetical protein
VITNEPAKILQPAGGVQEELFQMEVAMPEDRFAVAAIRCVSLGAE